MTIDVTDQVYNLQQFDVATNEDKTALRLWLINGMVKLPTFNVASGSSQNATKAQGLYTLRVGPTFAPQRFRRAIATAGFSSISLWGSATSVSWEFNSVDADPAQ